MATRIKQKNLSKEQITLIGKHLFLQPQTKQTFQGSGVRQFFNNKEPIVFFQLEDIVNDDKKETYVRLPYFYATTILQKNINANLQYSSISLKFTQSLRQGQEAIVTQAWKDFQNVGGSVICAPTGYGKTIMACYLACKVQLITLVLCTREILVEQWRKSFEKSTDAKIWVVGEKAPQEANVIICLDERVCKLPSSFCLSIGFLIIDEIHMLLLIKPGNM